MSDEHSLAPQDYTESAGTDNGSDSQEAGNYADGQGAATDQAVPAEGGASARAEAPEQKEPEQAAAPVEYEDFVAPEGFSVDQELMSEFKALAGKRGLKQEEAQALVDLQVKSQQRAVHSFMQQREQWRTGIKNDPDFGRERFESTINYAKRGLKALDESGQVGRLLVETGFGDHPEIIKVFARFGKKYLGEDETYTGAQAGGADKRPLADRLWPDMK